jgi:chromosome segregation ATPase
LFQVADLEKQNRYLQKSVSDLERMVLDVNCINSKLNEENMSLKERLAKETEKCNDMECRLQPAETALSQVTQEVADLRKQLVSLDTFVNNVFIYYLHLISSRILLIFVGKHFTRGNNKVD